MRQRLRAANFGAPQRDQELLGIAEETHPERAGADSLEHVRVGACPHREVVLPGEAKRLVVLGLEQEPRVVDLEHVDIGQVPVEVAGSGIVCIRSNGCRT